jgi:hypothetical protein
MVASFLGLALVPQSLDERLLARSRAVREIPNPVDLACRLRAGGEWCQEAGEGDEESDGATLHGGVLRQISEASVVELGRGVNEDCAPSSARGIELQR